MITRKTDMIKASEACDRAMNAGPKLPPELMVCLDYRIKCAADAGLYHCKVPSTTWTSGISYSELTSDDLYVLMDTIVVWLAGYGYQAHCDVVGESAGKPIFDININWKSPLFP